MGLSDDIDAEARKTAAQNEAEQLARAVLDATESGDVEEAIAGVSDLLGALHEVDSGAFTGRRGRAQPEFFAHNDWASVGIERDQYEGSAEIEMTTGAGKVSFWSQVPEVPNSSVCFDLSPASAMWLAEQLPEYAARAQEESHWENLKDPEVDDFVESEVEE